MKKKAVTSSVDSLINCQNYQDNKKKEINSTKFPYYAIKV